MCEVLDRTIAMLGPQEREIVKRIAAKHDADMTLLCATRLLMGQKQYGLLDLANDKRDFVQEKLQEDADSLIYGECEELRSELR